ncbi:MAG: hypothetical protein KA138_10805 [Saprospiraceae bacterium]|nr:hypothetical protein [Saprospiraceae bacterium]
MKLLQQTQLMFLRIVLPVFAMAGVIMYFTMYLAIMHESDEKLAEIRIAIEDFVNVHDTLPAFFQRIDERLEARPMPSSLIDFREKFSDTTCFNPLENEQEPFRRLRFPLKVRGQWMLLSILQSTVEQEELAVLVISLLALSFSLLFGAMLWVNRAVSRKVWQPFYKTLEIMRGFRLTVQEPLRLVPSAVQEFQELNATLQTLTLQVRKEFQSVRKFTENASHELQTPLAVIQNKLEMLLQDETLNEIQTRQMVIIGQSARRMARLNQSLLLLSKIENNQFSEQIQLELKSLVEKKLAWLEDFITEKQLVLETNLNAKTIEINSFLAETLISNLLTNAIKHNLVGGLLRVSLNERTFIVENSSIKPILPVGELTARFARGSAQTEGLGLGLSIVVEICTQQGLGLELAFEKNLWIVKIQFQK